MTRSLIEAAATASLARPPARHPPRGGLSYAGRRAALVPAPAATSSLAIFPARFRGTAPTKCRFQQFAATAAEASAPVAAFAFSALRLRLRFGSPCGGRRRAAGTASGRHHARATELFLPIRRHHPAGSCFAVSDHASFLPIASLRQERASVWLVCGSPFRCGYERRSAPQPSRIRLRPPAPTPRRTAANEQPVQSLAAAGPS